MASRKGKSTSTLSSATKPSSRLEAAAPFFPYARYISLVGVHTTLLAFVALFLPRTGFADFSSPSEARARTKRDGMLMLTENPLRTLGWMCAGALVLQIWWGSWMRQWALDAIESVQKKTPESSKATEKAETETELSAKDKEHAEKSERRLREKEKQKEDLQVTMRAVSATLASSFVLHIVAVLFGAPLTNVSVQTYLLCVLLSTLTVYPAACTLGIPSLGTDTPALVHRLTWVRLFAELSPRSPIERALVYPAVGACLGCWTGVIPIGLDWDRPWQAWPLTPAWGAFGGYIVGSLWAMVVSAIKNLVDLGITAQRDASSSETPKSKTKKKTS